MFAWLARFIESLPVLHRVSLAIWRRLPPRVAAFFRGLLTTNWIVGANAVILDENTDPPDILLVRHTYRTKGAWGLPGGGLAFTSGNSSLMTQEESTNDLLEATLRRELHEELGISIEAVRLLHIDAVPYIAEEPGQYHLIFYFRCTPDDGIGVLRSSLSSGNIQQHSPEIDDLRFVPLDRLNEYDLASHHKRFLGRNFPKILQAPPWRTDPQAMRESPPIIREQGIDGLHELVAFLKASRDELHAESMSLFTRDPEGTLVISAAVQEIPMHGHPPVIEVPPIPLPPDWKGVTGWLAMQTEPQRLTGRAVQHLFEHEHTNTEQPHLRGGKCVSLLSAIVSGSTPDETPIGLLKAENCLKDGEPREDGFKRSGDLRKIKEFADTVSVRILSLKESYQESLERRLPKSFQEIVSAMGTRADAESGVCRAISSLAPGSDIVLWRYREGQPERVWPAEVRSFFFPAPPLDPSAAESSSHVQCVSRAIEWAGHPDRGEAWLLRRVRLRKVCWMEGRPLYTLEVRYPAAELFADITERSLIGLMEFAGELLRVAAVRDESMYLLKHELGTGLQPLLNFAYVMQNLAEHRMNDPIAEAIEDFIPALRRWEDLVTRVEDFAAVVANEDFAVKSEKVDLAKVLTEIAESWKPLAVNRGLDLTVEAAEREILADPQLLKRAIAVALSNALKVSEQGTTIRIVSRRADHEVEIVVEDTGRGMSEQDRALFIQGRLLRRDPHRPGLGLGQILLQAYCKALEAVIVCELQKERKGLAVGLRFPTIHS